MTDQDEIVLPQVTNGVRHDGKLSKYYSGHKFVHINSTSMKVFDNSIQGYFLTKDQALTVVEALKTANYIIDNELGDESVEYKEISKALEIFLGPELDK